VPTRFLGYEVTVGGETYRLLASESHHIDYKQAKKPPLRKPAQHHPSPPRDYLIVQVIVALCDNENQGIARVPAALGNGQNPKSNLYWGAMYGLRTWFDKSKHWKRTDVILGGSIQKLAFAQFVHRPTTGKKVIVQAYAIDGAKMDEALALFFDSVRGGQFDLVVFVGHNGLMDTTLPKLYGSRSKTPSMVLACQSDRYFRPLIAGHSGPLLLSTFGNMAPEAYTLDAALRTWSQGGNETEIRSSAAKAYAKYQKCSVRAAERLFGKNR
jgi:hypothetical protein